MYPTYIPYRHPYLRVSVSTQQRNLHNVVIHPNPHTVFIADPLSSSVSLFLDSSLTFQDWAQDTRGVDGSPVLDLMIEPSQSHTHTSMASYTSVGRQSPSVYNQCSCKHARTNDVLKLTARHDMSLTSKHYL